jgi:hypothetical protein
VFSYRVFLALAGEIHRVLSRRAVLQTDSMLYGMKRLISIGITDVYLRPDARAWSRQCKDCHRAKLNVEDSAGVFLVNFSRLSEIRV